MTSLEGLDELGGLRAAGTFSWAPEGSGGGHCSPGAAAILGAEILDRAAFAAMLAAPDAARFEAAIRAGGEFRIDVAAADGRLYRLTVSCGGEGCARTVSGCIEDITESRRAMADFTAREELCRAVAETSPAMLWMGDENGKCVFLNRAQRDFWGVDPLDLSTFDWSSTIHPDDRDKLAAPFGKAMADHTPFTVEARYLRADGQYRTMRTQANPRFDRNGRFLGMTGVNADITDRLMAEERTRMLMGELNHRTKNILTVVQAVARQTARHSSPETFGKTFDDRLLGLAASNDLLLSGEWTGVDMAELVDVQLVHLADLIGSRIVPSGPPLKIASHAAQTLGMALHELSTNSIKHGALSIPEGKVALTWSRRPGTGRAFEIAWVESGVADVSAPTRKGFGHAVIVDMVAAALDADVRVSFEPGGFRWLVTTRSDAALA